MPTSHCNYPHHHGPSAGPPLGLLAAIALGAVVIAFWHTVIVALVVVTILAAIAGGVMLLVHAAHAEPYDAAAGAEDAATVTAAVEQQLLAHRVAQLERETVRDRIAAIETQHAARAEVERAVVLHAIGQQQQRQAIEAAADEWFDDRQAIAAEPWRPNQGLR